MRRYYFVGGLAALGLAGLIGWASLKAEPVKPASGAKPRVTQQIIERVPNQPSENEAPIVIPDPVNPATYTKPSSVSPPLVDPIDEPSGDRTAPAAKFKEPTRLAPEPIQIPEDSIKTASPARNGMERDGGKTHSVPALDTSLHGEIAASSTQPAVNMEWIGPGAVKVGSMATYTLVVRNTSIIPVQNVVVQARIPNNLSVASTDPKAQGADGALLWELGNLLAKQERRLAIKIASPQRCDVSCQAWVTFTGSSVMKIHVREPKLAIAFHTPDVVVVGEPANIVVALSNPGDHPADHVGIKAALGEGLESVRGNKLNYDIGALAPGETRTVTIPCITRAAGKQKCEVVAEANDGLKTTESVMLNVVQPRIDLALSGPKLRYLDKKAVYTCKVTNPGDAPASNVFVTEVVPAGFKFVNADNGGQLDDSTNSIKWFVGELSPGQIKEVKCELLATSAGEFVHKAMANASRNMKAEQELKTTIEGLSAVLMELVDLDDPVEVGSDTTYEIKVTNTGSKAETEVKLVCTIPPQLKLKSVNAPLKYDVHGSEIVFQTLPRLSPRADVVFKIVVTAQVKGDARFKASLTTSSLVEPVVKVEPTKVYAD